MAALNPRMSLSLRRLSASPTSWLSSMAQHRRSSRCSAPICCISPRRAPLRPHPRAALATAPSSSRRRLGRCPSAIRSSPPRLPPLPARHGHGRPPRPSSALSPTAPLRLQRCRPPSSLLVHVRLSTTTAPSPAVSFPATDYARQVFGESPARAVGFAVAALHTGDGAPATRTGRHLREPRPAAAGTRRWSQRPSLQSCSCHRWPQDPAATSSAEPAQLLCFVVVDCQKGNEEEDEMTGNKLEAGGPRNAQHVLVSPCA